MAFRKPWFEGNRQSTGDIFFAFLAFSSCFSTTQSSTSKYNKKGLPHFCRSLLLRWKLQEKAILVFANAFVDFVSSDNGNKALL